MEVRSLLALPSRLGGMGIINPTEVRSKYQRASQEVCAPLVKNILDQKGDPLTCQSLQASTKAHLRREKRVEETAAADNIIRTLPDRQRQCVKASQERGASAWLSVIPLERHGFVLHKSAFQRCDMDGPFVWHLSLVGVTRHLMLITSSSASLAASTPGLEKSFLCQSQNFSGRARVPFSGRIFFHLGRNRAPRPKNLGAKKKEAIFKASFCTHPNTNIINEMIASSFFFFAITIDGKQKKKKKRKKKKLVA